MRGWAIVAAIVLSFPLMGSLFPAPHAAPTLDAHATPLLPKDLSDADLLRMLAVKVGFHPTARALAAPPAGATLPGLVSKLALRMGGPADEAAAAGAPFATLDPRVAGPTTLLLAAVDQAWTMRDQAFAKLSPAEQHELAERLAAGDHGARTQQLAASVDEAGLINAAIMLDDTLESTVMPALQQAAQSGAWPAAGAWDSVGVLRLGSTGNDIEHTNRIVQIDPSGDDSYYNNAGGPEILSPHPGLPAIPVAVSVDFGGNDTYYDPSGFDAAQGGGGLGDGILLDVSGNDQYTCADNCQGGAFAGAGLLHDYSGNDRFLGGVDAQGGASTGIGILRDDSGDDWHQGAGNSDGYADLYGSAGLLWDRSGMDTYRALSDGDHMFGWAVGDNLGLFVDEGAELDDYIVAQQGSPYVCNDCTWSVVQGETGSGLLTHRETGNDDSGGLAMILAANGP